jgi:shikimate kinase
MPWSWKSTIARFLWMVTWYPILDIDTYMEDITWKHVSDILLELWDDKFLEFEKNITMSVNVYNTIISCSWSNPLKKEAMDYLRSRWKVIFIDIPVESIEKRLGSMKVDRIIWMANWNKTLVEILNYRKKFYEESFDFRFLNPWYSSKKETFGHFLEFLKNTPGLNIQINSDILNIINKKYEDFL